MSRRSDKSPHRRLSGGKTARSQPETVKSCNTAAASSKQNNSKDNSRDRENSRIRPQDICKSPEESEERRVRGFPGPDIHLAEGNKSTKGTYMTTFTEDGNVAHHKTSRFAKEGHTMDHSAHRTDILMRNTIPSSPSLVEFAMQREHGIPNDTIRSESVELGARRKHCSPHGSKSSKSVDVATRRNPSTLNHRIHPESLEVGTPRKYTKQLGTRNLNSVEFGVPRNKTTQHGATSPEAVEVSPERKLTTPQGIASPGSAEFGAQRKQANPYGTSRSVYVDLGISRSQPNTHVADSPEETSIPVYQEETDIIPSTEAEYSATETNPNNFNHLPSESATVSLDVPEQVDNSSADKTGEPEKEAGEKHGSSDSADDDSESREFFRCKICVSGRIRCWMLNPCHHLVCVDCKQKLSICPFCRTPIEDSMKIRYGFQ